jgi:hypothetical protein
MGPLTHPAFLDELLDLITVSRFFRDEDEEGKFVAGNIYHSNIIL